MSLKDQNKDLNLKNKEDINKQIKDAIEAGDTDKQMEAIQALMEFAAQDAACEVKKAMAEQNNDDAIMTARGVKLLTSEEKKYFKALANAIKNETSLNTTELTFPETTINRVFEELEERHEILDVVDFQNVTGITEFIVRTGDVTPAWWGKLTDEIKQKLDSGFEKKPTNLYKLTAYLPIAKSYLDLGPNWLETFIRRFLVEALSMGLEEGIVAGTGKDSPIGMDKDLKGSVVEGVYPEKTAIKIADLKPKTYGSLIGMLTNNGKRAIKEVVLVVNPMDYFTKIFPATTVLNALGIYTPNVLPFPTKICQSPALAQGKAILGLNKKYFMGLGSTQKIEKSDEYKFLEDERVYVGKMYGNGFPKDNDAYLTLDISEMEAITLDPVI